MKQYFLLFAGILLTLAAFSQPREVRGRVLTSDGKELSNVTVTVKGTLQSVFTQADGTFQIDAPPQATLVFTSIGYATQEVPVEGNSELTVIMESRAQQLESVVVVAYGSQVKRKVTGAVATVGGEELENKPFTSVDQILQGKVPGLQSVAPTGQPGGAQTIRIRGVSSITGENDPLFVVDGIPISSGDYSRNTTTSNALAGINPNDIESVSVLKDAAATAIYGSRAAAGVILITTKKGKRGKTRLSVDAEQGISVVAFDNKLSEPLNSAEYLALTREGLVNAGASDAQIEAILGSLGAESGVDTDWRDLVTRRANFTSLNFSAAGGNEKTTFYTSAGYNHQESPVIGSAFKRYSGSISLNHQATDRLSFSLSVLGSYTHQNSPTQGSAFRNPVMAASFLLPTRSPYDSAGKVYYGRDVFNQVYNPLAIDQYDREYYRNVKAISTIGLKYEILPQLFFSSNFGIDYFTIEEESYRNPFFGDARTTDGSVSNLSTRVSNYVWTNLLDYAFNILEDKSLGIDVKVGYEAQQSKEYGITASGTGVPFTTALRLPVPSTPTVASGVRSDFSQVSIFSILQLNYQSRYSLSGSFRSDGASRFGPKYRYGSYWSAGAAWNIDQEEFFSSISIVNALKLRASHGITGDNRGVTPYDWRATYAFGADYNLQPGSFPNTVGNPNLTWESNEQTDVGIDFGLLNNRLGGTVDWYTRTSKDLLFDVPLSLTSGFATFKSNVGTMRNRGWEFELHGFPVKNQHVSWEVAANISLNKNKVLSLPNNDADIIAGNQIRRVGSNVTSMYTRVWAGVDPDNGDPLWYTDASHKTTTNEPPAYREIIGHASPTGFGSLSTSLRFKGFGLSAQFYYQYGHLIYDYWGFLTVSDGSFPGLNRNRKALERWQKPGDKTDVPIYIYGNSNSSNEESSRWYYRGDFVRLRDLTLTYDFPESLLGNSGINSISLFVKGTNLWTKVFDDRVTFDPEQGFNGTNDLQVYIPRTFSVGLKVGL